MSDLKRRAADALRHWKREYAKTGEEVVLKNALIESTIRILEEVVRTPPPRKEAKATAEERAFWDKAFLAARVDRRNDDAVAMADAALETRRKRWSR